jgi:hypothetical protein
MCSTKVNEELELKRMKKEMEAEVAQQNAQRH